MGHDLTPKQFEEREEALGLKLQALVDKMNEVQEDQKEIKKKIESIMRALDKLADAQKKKKD